MQQAASIAGTGNTIVQIVGDSNSVTVDPPYLTLTRFVGRRHIHQDLDRLSPYTRSTPLLGRKNELENLHAFLHDPRPMLARVIIGGGGSGKTRLALELCEQICTTGWNAGFVTRTELQRFFTQKNLSDWGWQKPTLIVVDYAAEHAELLGKWLDELTDRTTSQTQVLRLLFLERNADTHTGWWATAFTSGGWGALNKQALLDPAEPVTMQPLAHANDRLSLLSEMLAQADPKGLISTKLGVDHAFRHKLMQLPWGGDPLFLMMAALAMIKMGHTKALALGPTDLAIAIAKREADRLQKLARACSLDPALVKHLAACVTLVQGMSREAFERFAVNEKAAINRPNGGDAAQLADLLQEALPSQNGIAPVLPDLIGEALLLHTGLSVGESTILRCHATFGHPVAESVIRCVQDFAQESPVPLQWLEAIVQSVSDDDDALTSLANSLTMESIILMELNLKVVQRLCALHAACEDVSTCRRLFSLNMLAVAQARVGQPETALHTAQEALGIYLDNPTEPLHNLASLLYNLSNRFSDLGQRERALHAAQEAADIYREFATRQPDVFRPVLAMSLSNLARKLSELGQRKPALHAAQQAVDILRELFIQRPDVFQPDLAASLDNLAHMRSNIGQHESALCAAGEAVDLYRELAAQRPDPFRLNLAGSLQALAGMLSDLGQRESALLAAQETVDLYREFAAQRPNIFQPGLAGSLNILANILSELLQLKPALDTAQEVVDIYREFATRQPDVFQPNLAMSLHNLARRFSQLNLNEPALHAAQEAVDIRRELFAQRPDAFRPNLAGSLDNLANMRSNLSQHEPALFAAQEALDHYRELATQQPDVFQPDLARSLHTLAIMFSDRDQHEPALLAAQEAVDIRRKLVAQRPNVFRPDLARSLVVLAVLSLRIRDIGNAAMALSFTQEAVAALQPAFLLHPNVHAGLMNATLRDYRQLCEIVGCEPDLALLEPLIPYFTNKD